LFQRRCGQEHEGDPEKIGQQKMHKLQPDWREQPDV